jgi:uncharacterized OB-fold protein
MSKTLPPTRICAACGKEIHANRGVCPECGHVTTWFQVKLMLGCAGAVFALLSIGTLIVLRMLGIA